LTDPIRGFRHFSIDDQGEISPLDTEPTAAAFKAKVRRQLEREGYTIIASLGDQVSDMSFGALKKGFLLPNLMYFIP